MHKLKEKFMDELYELEEKAGKTSSRITDTDLNKIHKLTDTIKNIDKIEMLEQGSGYSEESNWMGEGRMYGTSYEGGSYEGGSSYARGGGRGRGRNARRDSMGRYSSEGGSYRGGSYDDGMSYDGGSSYARVGNMGGRGGNMGGNRGGYSRDGAAQMLMEKAEEMLQMTHDPKERRAIEKFMHELDD